MKNDHLVLTVFPTLPVVLQALVIFIAEILISLDIEDGNLLMRIGVEKILFLLSSIYSYFSNITERDGGAVVRRMMEKSDLVCHRLSTYS